jgi:hypothetical protein
VEFADGSTAGVPVVFLRNGILFNAADQLLLGVGLGGLDKPVPLLLPFTALGRLLLLL